MPDGPKTRCFLACWPNPSVSHALKCLADRIQEQTGGRVTPQQNMHITLAFLGELMPSQLRAVEACCQPLPDSFVLTLDRIGFWHKSGIVWAGTRAPDPGFIKFTEALRHKLRRTGFQIDRRMFVPHLTLLRKVHKRPRILLPAMEWSIEEYQLANSDLSLRGSCYSILKRWSIKGDVK